MKIWLFWRESRLLTALYIFMCSVILISCASFYDVNVAKPQAYKQPDKFMEQFDLSGRFLIKNASKTYYGNFSWWRESGVEELDLNSPIGQTIAQIKIESGVAILTANGKAYTGDNLDVVMQQNLGFSLPLSYLYYWVQGFKLPDYPIENLLESGFTQLGWRVEYLSWDDKVTHLPQVIQCSQGDLSIKLVNKWN